MVLGLKVNFLKSCLIGINVGREFMDMACNFINCREGFIPFIYLGLPVEANPRRLTTWEPLFESLKNKLNSSGNKYVSLGGRVVLLNAVLNAIPIFHLSFLKLLVKVWKRVVKIQREFLWGGVMGKEGVLGKVVDGLPTSCQRRVGSWRYEGSEFESFGEVEVEVVTKGSSFVEGCS